MYIFLFIFQLILFITLKWFYPELWVTLNFQEVFSIAKGVTLNSIELPSTAPYAQEQSEWVFPTEKARAHDASN